MNEVTFFYYINQESMNNITVENHTNPIRLDRYLRSIDPLLTQGILEQYLRKKLILVNDAKATSSLRIANGDRIILDKTIAEKIHPQSKDIKNSPIIEALAKKLLGEYLLYDHPSFLAINKPSGLATQGGSKISLSIDDALSFLRGRDMDLKLVHRLDKDTSGVLLIAKGREISDKFMHAFKKHKVQKTYMAILSRIPKKPNGQIKSYLIKEHDFEVSSYDNEVPGSKEAITDYEVIETKERRAIVKFTPLTGRMHQLRVHARLMGCPIVGDVRYDGESASHLMLHAAEVVIDKCIFDKEIVVKAGLPEHFVL